MDKRLRGLCLLNGALLGGIGEGKKWFVGVFRGAVKNFRAVNHVDIIVSKISLTVDTPNLNKARG